MSVIFDILVFLAGQIIEISPVNSVVCELGVDEVPLELSSANGLYLLLLGEIDPTMIAVCVRLSLPTSGGGDGNYLHTHLPNFNEQEYIQHGTIL